MARARADVGEAEILQKCPDIAFTIINPKAALDDALKIGAPPAHNTIDFLVRSGLNNRSQFGLVSRREAGIWAARPLITQSLRPGLIEPMHPIAQRLTIHAANPRGVGPVHAVQHPSQRQQSSTLAIVLRALGQPAKFCGRKVGS
jgi:hypothetical protein